MDGELRRGFADPSAPERVYASEREWLDRDPGPAATAARVKREAAKTTARKRQYERRWHTIYLLYDARDRLLYVGISANGPARLPEHARDRAWFRKVARAEFEHVKGRVAAEARELDLITTRDPRWNRAGKPKPVDREEVAMRLVRDLLTRATCGHRSVTIADRCGLTIDETERALEGLGARKRKGAWT